MDPDLARKILEGYEDELSGERKKLEAFYRHCRCPRCQGACQKEASPPNHAFGGDSLVARSVLRCTRCRCLFDPHSDLVLDRGEPVPGVPLVSSD